MRHKVAIVGAGIIGMTNAIVLLENGYHVTTYTKEAPLAANSDAAVATWFAPDDKNLVFQQHCLESFVKFETLIEKKLLEYIRFTKNFFLRIKIILRKVLGQKNL